MVSAGSAVPSAALVAAQQPSRYRLLHQIRPPPGDNALQPPPLLRFIWVATTAPFNHVDQVVCDVAVRSVREINSSLQTATPPELLTSHVKADRGSKIVLPGKVVSRQDLLLPLTML